MQTETNNDMLSREDSVNLGMGRMSVRNIDSSEIDSPGNVSDNGSGGKQGKRQGIKGRMSSKRMSKMQPGAACNSCEQVCIIFWSHSKGLKLVGQVHTDISSIV